MKSNTLFYALVLIGSFISLFIPLWFLPFIVAIPVSYYFDVSLKKSMLVHLIVYAVICAAFCMYSYSAGSKELVSMIGQIFKGISFSVMMILSCVLFGVTAMLGAWVGGAISNKQ